MGSSQMLADASQVQFYVYQNYVLWVATTFAVHEHVITLQDEVTLIWSSRMNFSSWLFIVNRYVLLISSVIMAIPFNNQMCYGSPLQMFLFALQMMAVAVLALFSALRAFALLNRSYAAFAFVMVLGLVPIITSVYSAVFWTYTFVANLVVTQSSPCFVGSSLSDTVNLYLALSTRLSLITADLTVLIATWIKTYRHVKQASSLEIRVGISATLLRDGSLFFVVLLILNVLQLAVIRQPVLLNGNPITTIAQVVQSVLMSRFLINLRKADAESYFFSTSTITNLQDRARFSAVRLRIPTTSSLPDRGTIFDPQVRTVPEEHSSTVNGTTSVQMSVELRDMSDEQEVANGSILEVPRV